MTVPDLIRDWTERAAADRRERATLRRRRKLLEYDARERADKRIAELKLLEPFLTELLYELKATEEVQDEV